MRILLLFAHPVETSYHNAMHRLALSALQRAGHNVDDLDLYAEGFDPLLSEQERLDYHDVAINQLPVQNYVHRLMNAEALMIMCPVWNFGFPAILSGFLDRVFLPGVSFHLVDGKVKPGLQHIRRITAVTTYGAPRYRAFLMGDPPRKLVTRMLRALAKPGAPVRYLALYDMNRATSNQRQDFLDRVEKHCQSLR